MAKDSPGAAKLRVARRRARLEEQGLREVSSVIVPAHRENELRALGKRWTEEHLSRPKPSIESTSQTGMQGRGPKLHG